MDPHRQLLMRKDSSIVSKCLPLTTSGRQLKTNDGNDFIVSGLTAFPFINRHANGQNLDWIKSTYPRTNLCRTFWYTPQEAWGDKFWDLPSPDEAFNAHVYAADNGIYLYNTCLTDNADNNKLDQIKVIIKRLRESQLPNVLFESKNEPYAHDDLNPNVLKNALNSASPYLYTSGIYDENHLNEFWGRFGNNHCPRDAESVRKFADLEGLYNINKVPWFEGEPFKLPGYIDLDFFTFAAGTVFMGNGGIYHCQSMEFLNQPNEDEVRCGNLFHEGLTIYPTNTQLGAYDHRHDLEGIVNDEPTTCLRCYQKGNHAIVVRKNNLFAVPANWVQLDNYGVCYEVM